MYAAPGISNPAGHAATQPLLYFPHRRRSRQATQV